MPLPAQLLDCLACPACKGPLVYFPRGEADAHEAEGFLLCSACRLRFSVEDGIASLIVEEAAGLPPAEAERLLARARQLGLPAGHAGGHG